MKFFKATDVSIFFFEFLKLYSSSLFLTRKEIDEINLCGFLQAQLEMIMSANGLSENVFEIASKSLAA